MSILWTKEEEEFIIGLAESEAAYTYEEMADALWSKHWSYERSAEAIRKFLARRKESTPKETPERPKILLLDIETLPLVTYSWGIWKQTINDFQIIKDWCVLSWAAKWLFDSTMHGEVLRPNEAIERDDSRILQSIWELIDEADCIVAHNLLGFDIKKLNSRFFIHKMTPPSPYRSIDTLKHSRANFGFTSHKLNFLSQLINNKEKIKTGFNLWVQCDNGDKSALAKMFKYNKYDVTLLEEAYLQLLPWMKSAPNVALYTDMNKPICGHCGSSDITWKGYYVTPANKYRSFRCRECGGFGRSRTSELTKEQKANLIINTAK